MYASAGWLKQVGAGSARLSERLTAGGWLLMCQQRLMCKQRLLCKQSQAQAALRVGLWSLGRGARAVAWGARCRCAGRASGVTARAGAGLKGSGGDWGP